MVLLCWAQHWHMVSDELLIPGILALLKYCHVSTMWLSGISVDVLPKV